MTLHRTAFGLLIAGTGLGVMGSLYTKTPSAEAQAWMEREVPEGGEIITEVSNPGIVLKTITATRTRTADTYHSIVDPVKDGWYSFRDQFRKVDAQVTEDLKNVQSQANKVDVVGIAATGFYLSLGGLAGAFAWRGRTPAAMAGGAILGSGIAAIMAYPGVLEEIVDTVSGPKEGEEPSETRKKFHSLIEFVHKF